MVFSKKEAAYITQLIRTYSHLPNGKDVVLEKLRKWSQYKHNYTYKKFSKFMQDPNKPLIIKGIENN